MPTYRFKHWEDDPQLINPERIINITQETVLTAIYGVVETRKGLPSESEAVTVTVHPKLAETTVLTLDSDKTEYNSGDPITLTGNLKFQSDDTPLEARSVDIYKNDVKVNTVTTDQNGNFSFVDTAEDVDADTTFNYKAKFLGD